jgi:hypothetical protein
MPDPSIALRALQQIRGGRGSPVSLARRAILGDDEEAEALAGITNDEAGEYGGEMSPGDLRSEYYAEADPDPGMDPTGASYRALDAADAGDPNGAFLRAAAQFREGRGLGYAKRPIMEDEVMTNRGPTPIDRLPRDLANTDYVQRNARPDVSAYYASMSDRDREAEDMAMGARARTLPEDAKYQMEARRTGYAPADAIGSLGPVFAGLGANSAYQGQPRATTAPMGERYASAGQAPQLGATPEELDEERRRLLAGRY